MQKKFLEGQLIEHFAISDRDFSESVVGNPIFPESELEFMESLLNTIAEKSGYK
ncbi:MAG: hypothetical protein QNJ38_16250 [Prochloraceae cyanobacterium]|nr:hypothetical protein [Prochloraceae cyanobacterium]